MDFAVLLRKMSILKKQVRSLIDGRAWLNNSRRKNFAVASVQVFADDGVAVRTRAGQWNELFG